MSLGVDTWFFPLGRASQSYDDELLAGVKYRSHGDKKNVFRPKTYQPQSAGEEGEPFGREWGPLWVGGVWSRGGFLVVLIQRQGQREKRWWQVEVSPGRREPGEGASWVLGRGGEEKHRSCLCEVSRPAGGAGNAAVRCM